jgi:PKD repeat protein
VGQAVHFDGSMSSPSDPNASLTYAWDFGDGSRGTGTAADHAFAGPGTYTVRLTVVDSYNSSTTVAENVTVRSVPVSVRDQPPTAVITVQHLPAVTGQAVAYSGAGSSDSDGSVVSYRWSFGDGGTGTGPAIGHTYARAGTYSVTLTVTDNAGQSTTVARSLTVAAAGRITKVKVTPSRTGATVAVTVSSAGTLTAGRRVFHLRRATTVKLVVALSRAQLHTVQVKHLLKVRIPLKFAPRLGPLATTSAVIAFRPAGSARRSG